MTTILNIHPINPQHRLITKAVEAIQDGLIVYPTDSYYAFGCLQKNVHIVERIRQLRGLDDSHYFTLSCQDLTQIGKYGHIDNPSYRLIKSHVPGPYTFVLKATKMVNKPLYSAHKRSTIALRILSNPIGQALLKEIGEPIITSTLKLAGDDEPLATDDITEKLNNRVDLIIDAGQCAMEPTTVLDFTENPPLLIREGAGEVDKED